MLSYLAKISKEEGFFLVSFRDFYGDEPITQSIKYEEALAMAAVWLLSVAILAKEKRRTARAFSDQKRRDPNRNAEIY